MDQAKWYYICFNRSTYHGRYELYKIKFLRLRFRYYLNNDINLKRVALKSYGIKIFCGWKKLNKIIEEAHLLGLEDELLIFERRASNA